MRRLLTALGFVLVSAGCLNLDERLYRTSQQHLEHVRALNAVTIAAESSEARVRAVQNLKQDVEDEAAAIVRLADPARRPR